MHVTGRLRTSAALSRIYVIFPGNRVVTQFYSIFSEIQGWLVGMQSNYWTEIKNIYIYIMLQCFSLISS